MITRQAGAVGSKGFPRFSADVEVLEGNFQPIFEVLPLPTNCSLPFAQFSVEQLFWDAGVGYAGNMACPA